MDSAGRQEWKEPRAGEHALRRTFRPPSSEWWSGRSERGIRGGALQPKTNGSKGGFCRFFRLETLLFTGSAYLRQRSGFHGAHNWRSCCSCLGGAGRVQPSGGTSTPLRPDTEPRQREWRLSVSANASSAAAVARMSALLFLMPGAPSAPSKSDGSAYSGHPPPPQMPPPKKSSDCSCGLPLAPLLMNVAHLLLELLTPASCRHRRSESILPAGEVGTVQLTPPF